MADMTKSVRVDLEGNLKREARAYSDALGRFSKQGQRHMRVLSRASIAAGRGLDRAGNRMTALVAGAGGIAAGRQIGTYQDRLRRLARAADVSHERIDQLAQGITAVAAAENVRVPRGDILATVEAIVQSTGDLEFAERNLTNIGLALSATRAAGEDVGKLQAQFRKFGITLSDDVLRSMAILIKQGKEGSFEFRDMATVGAEAFSVMAAMGGRGEKAVREVGALLQLSQKTTESAAESVTAVRSVISDLVDKADELDAAGINVFDAEKLKEGVEQLRPLSEILKEIVSAAGGRATVLNDIFNERARKAVASIVSEFNETGGFGEYDKLLNVVGDVDVVLDDAKDAANDFAASWADITNAAERFADNNLAPHLKDVAAAIREIDPDEFDSLLNSLGKAAMVGGGLILLSKGIRTAAAARSLFGRGGAGRGAGTLAGAAAGTAAPMPVAVVNWPPGMMGGGRGGVAAGGRGRAGAVSSRAGRAASVLRGGGRLLGRGLPLLGAGLAVFDAGSAIADDGLSRTQKGARVGAAGGGLAGGAAGMAIGTAVFPGVGTAVGGMIGYLIGEYIGEKAGRGIADATKGDPYGFEDKRAAMSNGRVQLEISLDQEGRVTGMRSRSRGEVETRIGDAGGMFGGGVGF